MKPKLLSFSLLIFSIFCSHSVLADVSNVLLKADDGTNPKNPFMACLKDKIVSLNPSYDFYMFPGTEITIGSAKPNLLARTDVALREKSSGKSFLFKIVLTSTDTANGWQYYMDNGDISLWSTKIGDSVTFSLSPDNSPILKSFLVNDCPGSF